MVVVWNGDVVDGFEIVVGILFEVVGVGVIVDCIVIICDVEVK